MLRNLLQSALRITLLALVLLLLSSAARAATPNRAALIVQFADGSVETRCVEFNESQITGYDLLTRSGVMFNAAFTPGLGAAVCSIGGQGCSAENCFCEFPKYWSYWVNNGGGWTYSPSGSSAVIVRDGARNGWVWSQGDSPPPDYAFEQVCAPAAAPTDTPAPTPTVVLIPTDAPVTPSPEPSATSTPIAVITEPTAVRSEPTAVISEPTAVRSEPTAVRSEPTAARSEPTAARSEPTAVRSEPTAVSSTPTLQPDNRTTNQPINQYLGFGILLIGLALALIAAALRGQV